MAAVFKETNRTGVLAERLDAGSVNTTILVDIASTWNVSQGVVKINRGDSSEWVSFTGVTVVSSTRIQLTGCVRGLKSNAANLTDADSSNKKPHTAGVDVVLVLHSATINKFPEIDADNTFTGNNQHFGTETFYGPIVSSGTSNYVKFPEMTTAQRLAIVSPPEGATVRDTTIGKLYTYGGGVWQSIDNGSSVVNASTSQDGIVRKATDTQVALGTEFSGSGSTLFVNPAQLYGTGTAGQTLAANQLVYVKASDSKLYKADSNVSSVAESWNAIGIVVVGGAANATVLIQRLDGEYTWQGGNHGFTIGQTIYLSSTGGLTNTRPVLDDKNIVPLIIGTATSASKIAFRTQRLQRRMFVRKAITSTASFTVTVGFPISHVIAHDALSAGTNSAFAFGSGYYDVLSGGTGVQAGGTGAAALINEQVLSGTQYVTFTGSVDGSNNLVMTWAGNTTPPGNFYSLLQIYEAL